MVVVVGGADPAGTVSDAGAAGLAVMGSCG